MKKLYLLSALLLITFVFIYSCSTEEEDTTPPPSVVAKYTVQIESSSGGSVNNAGGEFTKGTSITITATPDSEYFFSGWSNGSSENPITIEINSNLTLTANFEKRKYPLTINIEGEGTISEEIVNTGKTTDYDSGTTVRLTANPSEGWLFSSWGEGYDSDELSIDILIDEPKEINVIFSEVSLASLELKTKSKIFTKGVADTLLIPINIPAGFKNINVFAEDGSISVESKPEEGDTEGNIIIRYTNQIVNNVDWDRTIAGHDNIDFQIEDLEENITQINYKLRTQPKPIYRDYKKASINQNFGQNNSRAKINPQLIKHLNRRGDILFQPIKTIDCFDDEYGEFLDYDLFGSDPYNTSDAIADEIYYHTKWDEIGDLSSIGDINYVDLNMDGYEDFFFSSISGDCFSCSQNPLEFYFYEDGRYIYKEMIFSGDNNNPKFYLTITAISDLDNDGDPDFIIGQQVDAQDIIGNTYIFENKLNENETFNVINFSELYPFSNPVNAIVDLNLDGLLDIFSSNAWYINEGNFKFKQVDQVPVFSSNNPDFEDLNSGKRYLDSFTHYAFLDFNNDQILDLAVADFENRKESLIGRGMSENDAELLEPPTKIYWGTIKETPALTRYGNSSLHLFFEYNNFTEIKSMFPNYIGVSNILFEDVNYDGIKEIIVQRGNTNGYYIQILKPTGKELIDITDLIFDEYKKDNPDNYSNENWCVKQVAFNRKLRVDDIDSDGFFEIFSELINFPSSGQKENFWKWNGSKYIKISE